MSSNPGRILVIRGGAIGDFILTLPVLSALRRQFPGAHIEVLGYPRIASLAKAAGLADEVRAIEGREFAMLFARGVKPASDIAGYFARFTLVVSYLFDPDGIFEENVTGCGCTQYLAGPHRPNEGERLHATDVLLKPLERLAVFDADPTPVLDVAPSGTANAITVALHPGSGSEHKNWPESNWRWLVELILRETSWNLLLVAGEAEGDRLKRVAPQPDARIRRLERAQLTEVATALAATKAFVGHDSGITHMAAALGRRCVVLWGRTNESIWRPRSERARILRSGSSWNTLSVDTVFNALREEVAAEAAG